MDSGGGDHATTEVHVTLAPEHRDATAAVRDLVGSHHATLRRLFPDVTDAQLERYWSVTLPAADADDLIGRLLDLPEVDGAYIPPTPFPA